MSKPPAQAQEAVAAPNASSLARADVKAIIAAVPKHKAPSWPQPDLSCHKSAGRSQHAALQPNGAQQHDPATERPRHCPEVVRAKLAGQPHCSAHTWKHPKTQSQAVTPNVVMATETSPVN